MLKLKASLALFGLAMIGVANSAFSAITLVVDPDFPADAAMFTVDPELHSPASAVITGSREYRQTFQLDAPTHVAGLVLALRVEPGGRNGGLIIRFYEVDNVKATSWSETNPVLVHTVTIPTTVNLPVTANRLGLTFTDDEMFFLDQRNTGTQGYAIELRNFNNSTRIGPLRHTNSGTEIYTRGAWYLDTGARALSYRDLGIAIIGGVPSADWMFEYEEFTAPFSLNFGVGQDTEDDLLRNRQEDFVLQTDSLRYEALLVNFTTSGAMAVVENYLDRQDFSLTTEMTLRDLSGTADNRVGLAVLGSTHNPPEEVSRVDVDSGFYGLTWVPANTNGETRIQIREGFGGALLADALWQGKPAFAGAGPRLNEDFEDIPAVEASWTTGGTPSNVWQFGPPSQGPGSAVSGSNVAGTVLNGFYQANTNAWLRTPAINLTGFTVAKLSFDEFLDIDATTVGGTMFHNVTISAVVPGTGDLIVQIAQYNNPSTNWRSREIELPPEALNREISLEFRLVSDSILIGNFAGHYIDNVQLAAIAELDINTYTFRADGTYDDGGILALTFTLTDEDAFSQSITAQIIKPLQGNLFGIGGRARTIEDPVFDFHTLSMTVGEEPGPIIDPFILSPFRLAFGVGEGRDSDELFRSNRTDDWSLQEESLRVTTATADYRNSVMATRVINFEEGQDFLLSTEVTLTSLDTSAAAGNRVGMVLFGNSDLNTFDGDDDGTFYTLQWIPNGNTGGILAFRQGMDGAIIAQTDLAMADSPPSVSVGATYRLKFYGFFTNGGNLDFAALITDGNGGLGFLTGVLNGNIGNRFGLGARHRSQENPVWDFRSFTWQNNPKFVEPDPAVVARDRIGSPGDYTTTSYSGISTEIRSNEFGLIATAGPSYFNHYAGSGVRDASTTLTNGFESGHVLNEGRYVARIDVGRGLMGPAAAGYTTVVFRLVTLDGEEIGEPTIIDPYDPPGEGEWTTMRVGYRIGSDNPFLGQPITWNVQITQQNPGIGTFGALDNVVVRFTPNIVATDEMLAVGAYTVSGPLAIVRDASGGFGLEARAGTHYIRYGTSGTGSASLTTRLTNGFLSGHIIQAGTYTASIDLGRAGAGLGRDSFETFEFRLFAVGGYEIGERTVIQPYVSQPNFGEWTTVKVSYTIEHGNPAIGQVLTWGGEGTFSASDVGKFGATDNVIVRFNPAGEPPVEAPTFTKWQTTHFGGETDPNIIGPEAAPAGDGIANLIKYAFGFPPMMPIGSAHLFAGWGVTPDGRLQLTYWERRGAQDIDYIPEASASLTGDWDLDVVEIDRRQDGDFDEVTVEAESPAEGNKLFMRVVIRQK
jgi:hypothetical protein